MIISICLPTYNREKELFKQLNIFFNQVKKINYNYEFIISDNNSKDNTNNVIKKFKIKLSKFKNVKFVTYKQKSNVGFTKNLLKTLKLATGDYAMILSDDDYPSKYFYKKLYEKIIFLKPKGLFFVPVLKSHMAKNLQKVSFFRKISSLIKEFFFEFSYINQRSGTMSGIMLRPKFISYSFITKKSLYPEINICINYYVKFGFSNFKLNEYINLSKTGKAIIEHLNDHMSRPKDYAVVERFNINEKYLQQNLISYKQYFFAFLELSYWFYDLKYQVKYKYKNLEVFNIFNKAILPKIKNRFYFYLVSFMLIVLPIKISRKNQFSFRKFVLFELLQFNKF